jgi:chloramphenicol 3-O phosphotransferase
MESGKIVILNGTSSSGKSSILKALQNLLPEPYLDAGIDKFIWMLPSRYLDRPLWDDVPGKAVEAGAAGHQLIRAMHRSIAEISRAGLNVLADHVLVEPDWVQDCAEVFHGLPAYLIGIHCPLEILEERERQRRDRTLGQARAQFDRVHLFADYDFEIDTSTASVDVCARQIAEFIGENHLPTALHNKVFDSRSSVDPG